MNRHLARALIGFLLYLLLVPSTLFIAAGTLKWPSAWAYTLILLASAVGSRLISWFRSPDVFRERAQFTQAAGTPTWDRVLVGIVGICGPLTMSLVAGLDHRLEWSPSIGLGVRIAAGILLAAGYGLAAWAMTVNRFFSTVARIQTDRDHQVVTSGPYRFVRHPAYAGAVVATLAYPVMLDAFWAYIPGLVLVVALVLRTLLEDGLLLEGLQDYRRYSKQIRFRFFPWIW